LTKGTLQEPHIIAFDPNNPYNHFGCWLDTELANTDKERSVVVAKGGAIIVINFKSKLVQSKE
jgi:hypothetical protein